MKERLLNVLFRYLNVLFKIKNLNKPKILLYTDSRGTNVLNKYGKTPWNSYTFSLALNYRLDYYLCPEKFTTIIDFVNQIRDIDLKNYNIVIMHCGVVDFSPRPLSNIQIVKASKASNKEFDSLFSENDNYYKMPFDTLYQGELTINLYSSQYLINSVIPQLRKINNLIWVDSNRFVKGWEGNYTKGRPQNIDSVVNQFDEIMSSNLANIISLKLWTDENIMKFTIDNIHFTKYGFKELYKLINNKIIEIN